MKSLSCLVAFCFSSTAFADPTLLIDYVNRPDPSFTYNLVTSYQEDGATVYLLRMQSQTWMDSSIVSQSVWQHDMAVIVPNLVRTSTATMLIDGGSNSLDPRKKIDEKDTPFKTAIKVSQATGSVVTLLPQVPNESVKFYADPIREPDGTAKDRSEDAIIAYTFNQYLNTPNPSPDWPALLPMTKAAVKAMDTTQQFVNNLSSTGTFGVQNQHVDDFVVLGGSKRGWTTWLTAAVDPRVKAIMPLVYDNLNIQEQFRHQPEVYKDVSQRYVVDSKGNKYSAALKDYIGYDLPLRFGDPEAHDALSVVDPYEYLDRYTNIPKYIVNSAGDEFFLIDSSRYYWDQLPGDKYLRYVPNTGHTTIGTDSVGEGYAAYFESLIYNEPLPQYTFKISENGENITAQLNSLPDEVHLWLAHNPFEPDFRHAIYGDIWKEQDVSLINYLGHGTYSVDMLTPTSGYAAYFLEFVHYTDQGLKFTFTTGISVIGNQPGSFALEAKAIPEVPSLLFVGLGTLGMLGLARWRSWCPPLPISVP